MHKVKSNELPVFLNVTPKANTEDWELAGNWQTNADRTYEATETEEEYVNDEGPTTEVDSYKVSLENEMKCVSGDPVFEYIDGLRYNLAIGEDAESEALFVDKYSYTEENSIIKYRAQLFGCSISISKQSREGGKVSTISYKVNCNGKPKNGVVTFANGKPTFTESNN